MERELLYGLGKDGRTILEWTLKRVASMRGTGMIRLRIGIIGVPCECGIEPPGP